MNTDLLIIAIVGLIGNIAIARTFDRNWAVGVMWTIFELATIAALWGISIILTA